MPSDNDDNGVGYGRPPKRNRFSKGQSGNPKGRPKGKLNLATVLERALLEPVMINQNGTRLKVTKLEAACKQLANKAASGDLAAVKQLTALALSAEERAAQDTPPGSQPSNSDQKVFQTLLRRLSGAKKENEDE